VQNTIAGQIVLMKDLSLMKSGATGERLYYKIQDFMWDEVLYEYLSYPKVPYFYLF